MDRERLTKQNKNSRSRILDPSEVSYKKRKRNKRVNVNLENIYATNQEREESTFQDETNLRK